MRSSSLTTFLLILACGLGVAAPAEANFPGKNGKIAFTRTDFDVFPFLHQVLVINADGSGRTLLADDARFPAWSADGTKLAFVSEGAVWTMHADGSGNTMVAPFSPEGGAREPAWSPDGESIAFARESCTGSEETFFCRSSLRVIGADGSGERTLRTTDYPLSPHWSPDGARIAFDGWFPDTERLGFPDVYTIHPDGTGETNLTHTFEEWEQQFDWSPDGSRILGVDEQGYMTINPDGTERSPFPHPVEGERALTFSPDGRKVVFGDFWNIWISNVDGTAPTQLTSDPRSSSISNSDPTWQPLPAPKRSDYKNASSFCKAEEAFWGDQFTERYGGGANAHGKCVSANK